MATRVLLDCDPGLDDALAILLAHGDPSLDLVAITTVGGNVALELTTENARELREYLGFADVPIAAGEAGPLGDGERGEEFHGETGLGAAVFPPATLPLDERDGPDLIIETLRSAPGEIHLVATGPMTNVAVALHREPRIVDWAASFTIMGGSFTRGNATPAAEFNIYADPSAARAVFEAGWQVVMVGLDVTETAVVDPPIRERMAALGRLGEEFLLPMATFWADMVGADRQAVHDVCAMAYVARPSLFTSRPARVDVETSGEFTTGMTVVDFESTTPNALVPVSVDVHGFWDYVLESYGRVAETL